MRHLLLFPAAICVGLPHASFAAGDDAKEIQKLISSASAMRQEDFEKLARSQTMPKASDFADKSLSLMLFALKVEDDEKAKEQFRHLTEGRRYPKPSELATEMYRSRGFGRFRVLLAPVTIIQADRITGCTCKVDDERATGTVSFKVPGLYEGKVDYVARKTKGKWRIREFLMPAYRIHIVHGKDGMWKEQPARSSSD